MQKFQDMVYERPDLEAMMGALDDYARAIEAARSFEELNALILDNERKTNEIITMSSLCRIRNTMDTRDEFYEAEMRYFNEWLPKLALKTRMADAKLLASPFIGDYENEYGAIVVKDKRVALRFADERLIPSQIQEANLTQKYSKLAASLSADFEGETCNLYGLLKHMQSTDRARRKAAFKKFAEVYARASGELENLYAELVALRVGMARTLGFDNYIDMAYTQRRRHDYTPKDAQVFREQVKALITPAVCELKKRNQIRLGVDKLYYYDESLAFPEGNPMPKGDKDALVAKAKRMYTELSPDTGEFFDFMTEYELFDLETRAGKRPGGYCSSLPKYNAPFIFSNFNGTSADVDVLTHEAGHAFAGYVASRKLKLRELCHSTSEINEIHSMAMEHFTYPWMELFFEGDADRYRSAHLESSLTVIPYMCAVDEFQHRVFENPNMGASGWREAWREIEKAYMPWRDYDGDPFLESGGFWMQKQHIFLFPFYYIEYALAQMGAFEFYGRMLKDRERAWGDYVKLCQAGGSMGYFDLLKLAGLSNPFKAGGVQNAIRVVLDELKV